MSVYKFRVVVDIEKDVFRDIEIQDTQTFENLHKAIINSYEFAGDQMASFYMSDDSWEKGQEIGLMDMSFGEEAGPPSMGTSVLKDFITEKNQKILYVYDFLRMWIFYVELMEEKEEEADQQYPCLALSFGDAPFEEDKDLEDLYDGIEGLDNPDKADAKPAPKDPMQAEIDDIMNEFDEDSSEPGFENIDDFDF